MRTNYIKIGFFAFVLVVALGLAAAQGPAAGGSPQDTSSPQASPQATPQQPSQAPPSADQQSPSQSSPSSSPSQQPSGQAGSAPQSSQAQEDNPLNLTDEQKTKLRPIIADENQQLEAVRNDSSMTAEQKVTKANQIKETAAPKIKAVLTPEQLQKLAELQQKARQQQPQSQPQQQSPAQQQSAPPPRQ